MSAADYDIVIVGSGFGGALLAQVCRRLGRSVLLIESSRHPRFAIGESTSPLTNLLIEQIAARYDLPRLLPLAQWGTWQETYPEMGCGLKRGFTYFHHKPGERYAAAPDRSDQLLVAASPRDWLADTHWYRADVDHFLVREAINAGAEYVDEVCLSGDVAFAPGEDTVLTGTQRGRPFRATARLVVDASGGRGFLARALGLEGTFAGYPGTQALFAHFRGVARCDAVPEFATNPGDALPYPVDDAAVHHVFADGGWMWVLRFASGITSAGVTLTDALADEVRLSDGAGAWPRLLARYPALQDIFADAETVEPLRYAPRLAHRCTAATGPGWAMLPSAASFIDPLFSTGFPLTLLGIERLGRIFEESWGTPEMSERLAGYGETTLAEADGVAAFIAAFYDAMPDFESFTALSMFYFAAASYSEMARRLDRPHLVRRFLAQDHPTFWPGFLSCADMLRRGVDSAYLTHAVKFIIAPLNIAGLCDPRKRNWYGVDLNDLVRGASKLELTPDAMRDIIATAPWSS